jgi:hypothetical protein
VSLVCLPTDTYHPFTPPGDPEHVGELGYTYRDPYALTQQAAAAHGSTSSSSSSSSSSSASSSSSHRRILLGRIGTTAVPDTVSGPNAGHKVGSPAARAALQRALNQWGGGYSGYQWQLQFTALRRYQHSKKPANVFVLLKDMPGADPMPSAGKGIGAGGIDPDEVRARPDFCGSIEGRKEQYGT